MCVIAVGTMVGPAEEAAELLEARGVSTAVWDVRVVPLDTRMLAGGSPTAGHRGRGGIAEGGVGSLVAGALARLEHGGAAPTVVARRAADLRAHGKPAAILANLGLDATGIAARSPSTTPGSRRRRARNDEDSGASASEAKAVKPRGDVRRVQAVIAWRHPTKTEAPVFIDGFVHQLPDVDPQETVAPTLSTP